MKRDFVSIEDITAQELQLLLEEARLLKQSRDQSITERPLHGKTLAMIFEKASTRTRISFEVGMFELGGHALFLNPRDMQLGRGEEIRDTARVISRYVTGVMIRAYRHETVEEFALFSRVPVINGLSDREHPCQILADLMTMKEHFSELRGLKVAWIGDGNNVCSSLVLSAPLTGIKVVVASPLTYSPPGEIITRARSKGGSIEITDDPFTAAQNADVVYTDVWVSMGDEAEQTARMKALKRYAVTTDLISCASRDAVVLHCLPAHRGEEISDEVLDSPHSAVWDQAENRLHTQKALLNWLLRM